MGWIYRLLLLQSYHFTDDSSCFKINHFLHLFSVFLITWRVSELFLYYFYIFLFIYWGGGVFQHLILDILTSSSRE